GDPRLEDPYVRCRNGAWDRGRDFDLAEYVDAGWDEGINCSEYRSASFEAKVMGRIRALEVRDDRPYACPVAPAECPALVAKYGPAYSPVLLHPRCAGAGLTR